MLPSLTVPRRLCIDAAVILAIALVLGTAANLVPSRHVAWWGQGKEPPREGTDFTLLDPLSADALLTSLPSVVFLDTRTPEEFDAGHVPGAIRIDYTNLSGSLTAALQARLRHADAVILYGASTETDVEQLAAQDLRLRGFAPPNVLLGGFPAWQASGLPEETSGSRP